MEHVSGGCWMSWNTWVGGVQGSNLSRSRRPGASKNMVRDSKIYCQLARAGTWKCGNILNNLQSLRPPETNDVLGCDSWFIVRRSHAAEGTVCLPRKQMTLSAVIHDSSSVSVNITRPEWLNTHTPPALIMRNVSPPFFQLWSYAAIFRELCETSICNGARRVRLPDKRQRNGIGGKASVDVAIGGETSVNVEKKPLSALSDAVSAPGNHWTRPQFRATLPPQRVHHDYTVDCLTSLFIKALKKTSNLHENSGTVEYFAGQ